MMTAHHQPTPTGGHSEATPDVELLLDSLSDAYACEILCALDSGPMSADDLVDRCEMSRPTVYRRLDELTDVGLVENRRRLSADGHHCQEFSLSFSAAEFRVHEAGVDVTVRHGSPANR